MHWWEYRRIRVMVDQFPLQSARRSRLRAALLGTAAAGVLLLGYGRRAYAQSYSPPSPACTADGTDITCSGDLSDGVLVDGGTGANAGTYDYLKIENLTEDIAPASTVDGVQVTGDGDFKVYTEASDHSIVTSGDQARGIFASSNYDAVTVTNNLSIMTDGTTSRGIQADSGGSGNVKVTNKAGGTITTHGDSSDGILAYSESGYAKVYNYAAITTHGNSSIGIYARVENGDGVVIVENSAAITTGTEANPTGGDGIDAKTGGTGYVRVTNKVGGVITTWATTATASTPIPGAVP
jgi:hypothetical protein